MTFPVPYDWFVALEQPGIHSFHPTRPAEDSDYLERFGFIPSPKTIHTNKATLAHYGYYAALHRRTGIDRRHCPS